MRKVLWLVGFLLVAGPSLHPVLAADKVPPLKPLASSGQPPFLEGIDVPPAKPKSGGHTGIDAQADAGTTRPPASVCEVPGAVLETLDAVSLAQEGDEGCGIDDPVRLKGVEAGDSIVRFSSPVTVSCGFARVLTGWLREDVLPAADGLYASPVSVITSGPGYQCRRRNNRPDGKLSEHALGNAVDLLNFQLADGTSISIEKDWAGDAGKKRFLQAVHDLACERFSTVLGPEADPEHHSHFHLDTGCHGKTCTYLICQ